MNYSSVEKSATRARKTKAERLMDAYRDLGFTAPSNVVSARKQEEGLVPVSFIPPIDYSISTIVGA